MLLVATLLAVAPLAHATLPTPSVAIIGAGAGGSSAAYWIALGKNRAQPSTPLNIDVYEKNNYIGGRSTIVYPYDNPAFEPLEQGAGIFTDHNKNMMRAVSEFGLSLSELGAVTPGIGVWNGKNFTYRDTGNDAFDNGVLASRYADGPVASYYATQDFLEKFDRSYAKAFPNFATINNYAATLNYTALRTVTLQSYLRSKGVNTAWINDFQAGSVRFNYGQDASTIQAVAGMTSLAADSSHSVAGGNYKIFKEFLTRSKANVKLNTVVTKITKSGSKYIVQTSTGAIATYDAVILAAPAALSGIKFSGISAQPAAPAVNYLHLHATLIATTTPAVLPGYFNTTTPPDMPGTIITTAAYGFQPEFFAFRYESSIQRNGRTEYIVRVYSKAAISDATMTKWFGAGTVGWVNRKEWDAYPIFPPRSDFPPVRLDKGMYYVNAMEGLLSTMETEIISSRNAVDLAAKELLGYGVCGPAGPQGPQTDNYVLGWDC